MSETLVGGLRWVKGEIALTLRRVTGLVEAYGQDGDPAPLGDAADALHEVRGVLLALALELPAALVAEMEQLCDAAGNCEVAAPTAAAEALLLALMRLPAYLDQLDAGVETPPTALWAAADELRAARGAAPLGSGAAFGGLPGASPGASGRAVPEVPPPADLEALGSVLRQARPRFHRALLEWYRPVSGSDGLARLGLLFHQLLGPLGTGPVADLFRLAQAHATALRCGDLPADAAARALLGQLDRVFKPMAAAPPEWPGADLCRLAETFLGVLAAADLETALVAELAPRWGRAGPASALPDGAADALASLAVALLDELAGLKARLDTYLAGSRDDLSPLRALADGLDGLSRTLDVADTGRDCLPERLRLLGDAFRGLSRADVDGDAPALEALATELLGVEAGLAAYAEHRPASSLDLGALGLDAGELVAATLREVCTEFVAVKEAIGACQPKGARPEVFATVPQRLSNVAGALQVLGQTGPARLCEGLAHLIERAYLSVQRWPQGEQLDHLAETVAALELHSERVSEGQAEDPDLIRRGAEALGVLAGLLGPESAGVAVPAASPTPVAAAAAVVAVPVPPRSAEPTPPAAGRPQEVGPAPVESGAAPPPAVSSEFLEIFMEEVEEELEVIREQFARWRADASDEVALTRLRRSFHTLKGSGRMVGARRLGDLAWTVEDLCNHLIDQRFTADAAILEWLAEVIARLPEVLAAEASGAPVAMTDLTARAAGLGRPGGGAVPAAPSPTPAASEVPGLTDHTSLFAADEALLEIFRAETLGHLEGLRTFLAHATLVPRIPEPATLRALHTLSGSARMAGIDSIAQVAKTLEERLLALAEAGSTLDVALLGLMQRAIQGITGRVAELPGAGSAAAGLLALAAELDAAVATGPVPGLGFPAGVALAPGGAGAPPDRFDDLGEALAGLELPELEPLSHSAGFQGLEGDADAVLPQLVSVVGADAPVAQALFLDDLDGGDAGDLPILLSAAEAAMAPPHGAAAPGAYPGAIDVEELPVLAVPDLVMPDLVMPDPGVTAPVSTVAVAEPPGAGEPGAVDDLCVSAATARRAGPDDLDAVAGEALAAALTELVPTLVPDADAAVLTDLAVSEGLSEPWSAVAAGAEARAEASAERAFAEAPAVAPAAPTVSVAAPADQAGGPPADLPFRGAPGPAAAMAAVPGPVPAPTGYDPCPDDQEMLGVFLEEARDLLDGIDSRVRAWQLAPRDLVPLDGINRLLHTLKGGARLTGLRGIGDLSHALETRLTGIANARGRVDDTTLELTQQAVDTLSLQIDALEQRAPIPRALDLAAALNAPCEPVPEEPAEALDLAILTPAPAPAAVQQRVQQSVQAPGLEAEPWLAAPAAELPAFLHAVPPGGAPGAVPVAALPQVRMRSDLIDRLVDNAGEIGLYRARLSQRNGLLGVSLGELDQTVRRLREQLRLLEIETEAQILFRFDREAEADGEGPVFDPLELDRFSTLQRLSRSLAETVNDLGSVRDVLGGYQRESADLLTQQSRLTDDLQDGLLRTRMVPFVQVVPRLHRLVRQTAEDLGKSARLTVIGPEVELDRVILNRLVAPLEHLLRNAVDHGLESAAARAAAGKPASGALTLELSREGSEVVIRLGDDGPGLDLAAVRAQAVARGLLPPQAEPDDTVLMQFVFEPGFTTQAEVTQISGRGVGLDVVASEIKAANGSIDLQSAPGRGLSFTIRLPLTLAIVKALLVGVGGSVYALPHAALEAAARIGREDLAAIYAAQARGEVRDFEFRGQAYRVASLGNLLDPWALPDPGDSRWAPLLLVRVGEQRVALHVDSLMESTRILVKPLAARLGALRWLAGGTILPDGRVALILDLPALLRTGLIPGLIPHLSQDLSARSGSAASAAPATCVMVVDDSLTVRRVTSRMLEHRQIEVMTARDGVEALTLLDERLPDLILLDVEMPRMDGYELTRHIRQSERLRALPIIMITSRTGAKHLDHALGLGVDRYLGKPYQEGELLAEIQSLLAERRR